MSVEAGRRPRMDTARMVERKTSSSVRGPWGRRCERRVIEGEDCEGGPKTFVGEVYREESEDEVHSQRCNCGFRRG